MFWFKSPSYWQINYYSKSERENKGVVTPTASFHQLTKEFSLLCFKPYPNPNRSLINQGSTATSSQESPDHSPSPGQLQQDWKLMGLGYDYPNFISPLHSSVAFGDDLGFKWSCLFLCPAYFHPTATACFQNRAQL